MESSDHQDAIQVIHGTVSLTQLAAYAMVDSPSVVISFFTNRYSLKRTMTHTLFVGSVKLLNGYRSGSIAKPASSSEIVIGLNKIRNAFFIQQVFFASDTIKKFRPVKVSRFANRVTPHL